MELSYFVAGWPAGGAGWGVCDFVFGGEREEPVGVSEVEVAASSSSSNRSSNAAIVGIAASVACV